MNTCASERHHLSAAEHEALIRTRLATSRADLLASSIALREHYARLPPSLPARGLELVSTAPNVTLLAAAMLCALVVGPRKMASVLVRNGLVGWVGNSVRRRAGR